MKLAIHMCYLGYVVFLTVNIWHVLGDTYCMCELIRLQPESAFTVQTCSVKAICNKLSKFFEELTASEEKRR